MKILNKDIKLVIFDLDGTILDSTSLWSNIDKEFFHRRNMEIPPRYNSEIAHLGLDKAALWTKTKYCSNESVENILKEWKDMSFEAYKNSIELKPFAKEFIELLKRNNVKLAIATANSKELYEVCLKRTGIFNDFEFVIDVNSTSKGKTSSEIYDRVASRFNLHKDNIMILEDLPEAMETAFKAGYFTIGVYDKNTSKNIDRCKSCCNHFIHSFDELISLIN